MPGSIVPLGDLTAGWHNRADPSKIPKGAALEMRNCIITDRDGIAPRPGTLLMGASDNSGTACVSGFVHRDRSGNETPMRTSGTILEIWNETVDTWFTLKSGFTSAQEFGFADHSVNTDATDYNYFCNAVDPYQRWRGYHSLITSALVGAETTIPVSTTLLDDVFYTGTASAVTTTTVTIATSSWATDLWNTFYVRITNGASQGKISLISATTATQITFTAIAGLAGTPTFEIRKLAVPTTGTLIYGGTTIAYTAVPTDASFTVGSAHAAADNTPIALVPEEILTNGVPRGNRLIVDNTRMFVAGVIGNGPSTYYSKIANAGSFSFSSPRIATDGGVIDTPEGGGKIRDLVAQEDVIYILKNGIVKTVTFTQDGNDLPQIQPLVESNRVSVVGRVFKTANDVYFATQDNSITSLGRLPNLDQNTRAFDISYDVKKGVSLMDFSNFRGIEYQDRSIMSCKETEDSTSNDVCVVFNSQRQRWEGVWDLDAADFFTYQSVPHFVSSSSKETYKMFEGIDKDKAGVHYPVNSFWKSGYLNYTKTGINLQELYSIIVSGWISSNTTLTFDLTYDFGNSADVTSWEFSGVESDYIFGEPVYNVLGQFPLGVVPLGMIGEEILDNKRKFLVIFNVPAKQHHWFQFGFGSNGLGQDWEITDVFFEVEPTPDVNHNLIKDTESS